MTPTPHAALDWSSVADWYDANAERFTASSLAMDVSPQLRAFAASLPRGGHVCDAGCGAGRDAAWLLDQGFEVTGFDISAAMIASARALTHGRARFLHAGFANAPLEAQSFDGIWALASLLHLPKSEVQPALARLLGALKPGGLLVFSLKEGAGEAIDALGRPMAFYSVDEVRDLARHVAEPGAEIDIVTETAPSSTGEVTWITARIRTETTRRSQ